MKNFFVTLEKLRKLIQLNTHTVGMSNRTSLSSQSSDMFKTFLLELLVISTAMQIS